MAPHALRRILLLTVMVAGLATPGSGQTAVGDLLGELSRYLGAAVRFTSEAVLGVGKVEASQVPADQRDKVLQALNALSRSLTTLSAGNAFVIANLSDYATGVRQNGCQPGRNGPVWQSAMDQVTTVSGMVNKTLTILEQHSAALPVALSPAHRVELRTSLKGRQDLFALLRNLPPPCTPAALDQLDTMNKVYAQLIQSLKDLNVALDDAIGRLGAE